MTDRRPVRVLHVLGRLSPGGGIQIVVRRLAASVDPHDVELHVVTARPPRPQDEVDQLPLVVHHLGQQGKRGLWARLRVVVGVARRVRSVRPDVVQLHSGIAWMGLAARLVAPRTGFVLEVHDAPGSGRHGAVTDRVEGWWVRFLGAVAVCHSSSVADEIRTRWRPRSDRLVVFPLAVDTDVFRPRRAEERDAWRRSVGVPEGMHLLIVAGRLAPSKRFERAIDAIADLVDRGQEVGLVIVGGGSEETALRKRATDHGISDRVWFTGALYGDELAAAIGAGDVLCSPSEYEGFGLTLVEGMASGLPVVAVAVGGVTDLVVDACTGLLVEPDQTECLPDRIGEVLGSSDGGAAMGAAGRERVVELYGVAAFVRAFTGLYRRVGSSGLRRG